MRDLPSNSSYMCSSTIDEFNDDMAIFQPMTKDRNRVLINCIHGHSRSASVVI